MRAQCSLEAPGFQEAPDVTPPGFMKLESRALRSQALDFHLETGPNVSACLPASSQMPPSCQAAVSQGRTQLKRKGSRPSSCPWHPPLSRALEQRLLVAQGGHELGLQRVRGLSSVGQRAGLTPAGTPGP